MVDTAQIAEWCGSIKPFHPTPETLAFGGLTMLMSLLGLSNLLLVRRLQMARRVPKAG